MRRPRKINTIVHPTADELYQYALGEIYTPGAQGEVFLPLTTNPLYSFRGTGRLAGSLRPTQPPQVIVQPAVMVAGIPTIAGTFAFQGVTDPDGSDS